MSSSVPPDLQAERLGPQNNKTINAVCKANLSRVN